MRATFGWWASFVAGGGVRSAIAVGPAAIASVLLTMAFMLSTITTANTQPKYLPRGLEPADHVIQPVPIRGQTHRCREYTAAKISQALIRPRPWSARVGPRRSPSLALAVGSTRPNAGDHCRQQLVRHLAGIPVTVRPICTYPVPLMHVSCAIWTHGVAVGMVQPGHLPQTPTFQPQPRDP
jgi:hypothetical protein